MRENLCAEIQVVVLMGGAGKRLGSLTKETPKPMIKINGRPFFEYQLMLMREAGFKKFLFCTGYHSDEIINYFGSGENFGVNIKYSFDGETLKGTGGAVINALPLLEDKFLLVYADSFMDVNYFAIIIKFLEGLKLGKTALMTIIKNYNKWDKSNVLYNGREIELYDKNMQLPEMQYIDYGISMFAKSVFTEQENYISDLADIQHKLSIEHKLSAFEVYNRFYEIGTPESLAEFEKYSYNRFVKSNRAIFLDRDGVINKIIWNDDIEQLDSPMKTQEFELLPGVIEALRMIQGKNFLLFIVTNQPGAAKGKTNYLTLCEINDKFINIANSEGINISCVEMCPHYAKESEFTRENFLIHDCTCRKPKTGMIDSICAKFNIDIKNSWMAGDSASDIICGRNSGLKTAFIGNFKCDSCHILDFNKPDIICRDLYDFAKGLVIN